MINEILANAVDIFGNFMKILCSVKSELLTDLANIAVILGVFFGLKQLKIQKESVLADHERRKKQSTVEFHNTIINPEAIDLWNKIEKTFKTDDNRNWEIDPDNNDMFKTVQSYFTYLERFSVGVNIEAYDIGVVNQICGTALKNRYKHAKRFIKQRQKYNSNAYKDFERLVERLEELEKEKLDENEKKERAKIKEFK